MIPEGNGLGQVGCGVNRLLWLSFADAECAVVCNVCVCRTMWSCVTSACPMFLRI